MLSKPEAVNHLYKTIKAFIINITIEILEFIQNFYFNICVINIKFLILANLSSYYPLIRIFVIYTLNNLTKCSLINQLNDLVTISNMFSYSYQILPVFISYLVLVLSSNFSYCINSFKHSHFNFFEFGQLLIVYFQSIHGAQSKLLLVSIMRKMSKCTL